MTLNTDSHKVMAGAALCAGLGVFSICAAAQTAGVHYDSTNKVFRLDGGDVTYAFGVNEVGSLQPVYWGKELAAKDTLPAAHTLGPPSSFDSSATTTPGSISAGAERCTLSLR